MEQSFSTTVFFKLHICLPRQRQLSVDSCLSANPATMQLTLPVVHILISVSLLEIVKSTSFWKNQQFQFTLLNNNPNYTFPRWGENGYNRKENSQFASLFIFESLCSPKLYLFDKIQLKLILWQLQFKIIIFYCIVLNVIFLCDGKTCVLNAF